MDRDKEQKQNSPQREIQESLNSESSHLPSINVSGITIKWDTEQGTCTFEDLPVAMMWIWSTLAGMMSGVQAMVGTERFGLALQSHGRDSVNEDWQVISGYPDFPQGFKAIAVIAAVAGWGCWELVSYEPDKKICHFRATDSWEGRYQKALGVCWGSSMLAGKLAGYCSKLFDTNCWADQTTFIARDDESDEFIVHPSKRSVEKEIESLLATDEATRADMAVALQELRSEIDERKRAEEALRESEWRLNKSQEIAHLGSWELDIPTNRLIWSDEVYRIFGLQLQEFAATYEAFLDVVHPDDRAAVDAAYSDSLRENQDNYEIEHRVIRKPTGEIRYVHEKCENERDASGKIIRSIVMVQDITERKQAELALKKANRTLKALSGVNQVLVHATEESALLNDVCRLLVEIGGYRMAWIGFAEHDEQKTVRPVAYAGYEEGYFSSVKMTWSDTELGQGATGMAIRTGKPNFAIDILTDPRYEPWREEAVKRGYASSIAIPLAVDSRTLGALNLYAGQPNAFDEEEVNLLTELVGDLSYGIMSLRAREERRRAEEALHQRQHEMTTLLDNLPAYVFLKDVNSIYIITNRMFYQSVGRELKDIIGKTDYDIFPKELADKYLADDYKMISTGEALEIEEEETVYHGKLITVSTRKVPLKDEKGKVVGLIGIAFDITARKLAEQRERELEEHKREFYRRTIMAATEGKLLISERDQIEKLVGPPITSWEIARGEDLGQIRRAVAELAESNGMEVNRIYDFVLAIGEATTNAFKHADGGTASLHKKDDCLIFKVSDMGPGIEALTLPEVALLRGYSTAGSLGMGYKAILSIADKVYLATGPSGTTVAIEMSLKPVERPLAIAALPDTWRT